MTSRRLHVLAFVTVIAAHVVAIAAQTNSSKPENWVPTWGTAQQLVRTPPPPLVPNAPASNAPAAPAGLAATSATAQRGRGPAGSAFRVTTLSNQTVRMILRTSIGGRRARVKLSNAFGSAPVLVGAAHLAKRGTGSAIVPGTDRALTFAGQASFTMMPGWLPSVIL
jgi:hypothetical protein